MSIVIHNVPYVDVQGKVRRGKLVSVLDLAGDRTIKPGTHVAMFAGDHPCDRNGNELPNLKHSVGDQQISDTVVINRSFSCKPASGYTDYYHKVTTYVAMIAGHAEQIDPSATARTFQVIENHDDKSPFNYIDNASGRAGITEHAQKLALVRIAIIGLGGTGSYVLDLVAKTPVQEIHLYDGDWYVQHNAFRSPGAATVDELYARLRKVDYFHDRHAPMRRGIVPHPVYIDTSNVDNLREFDFALRPAPLTCAITSGTRSVSRSPVGKQKTFMLRIFRSRTSTP